MSENNLLIIKRVQDHNKTINKRRTLDNHNGQKTILAIHFLCLNFEVILAQA